MTTEDKQFIRHRINEACGGDIGDVHPEFFITATTGPKIQDMDNTNGKFPHFKTLLVNGAGQCMEWGVVGCN